MVVNIVHELSKFGLSEYEAKTWIALVNASVPLTSYEAARESGVPSSKIYEVMAKLAEKEMVVAFDEGSKKKYLAQDTTQFLDGLKDSYEGSLRTIREELAKIKRGGSIAAIWNFNDYDALVMKAERMICEARDRILLSCWKEEAALLEPALSGAQGKGLKIAIVHFGAPEIAVGRLYPHPIEDTLYAEKGGRGFTLVVDGAEALSGTISEEGRVEGAWSMNAGFATLAEDYVKHDVYIMKIVGRFDALLIERFGKGYAKLRDVFNDEEAGK